MERIRTERRWRLPLLAGAVLAGAVLLRRVLTALVLQVLAASVLMALALPLCRRMEKRLPPGPASALSLLLLGVGCVSALALLVPPFFRQLQQLTDAVPILMAWLRERWQALSLLMARRGVDLSPARQALFDQLSSGATSLLTGLMGSLTRLAGSVGKLLLAPLLAFYLLRDRRQIASMLTLLLPVKNRARGVRAAREMRRETEAYLRGQLLLSLSVGVLTAAGLLLTGTPGWLILGILMGVMELVPYVGPFIAGAPAVLLALESGWLQALWTLAVLLAVQQAEGAFLSPRLVGGATGLHPMAVLLLLSAGGMLAGALGMVLVIPLVVSLRGALRGWRAAG